MKSKNIQRKVGSITSPRKIFKEFPEIKNSYGVANCGLMGNILEPWEMEQLLVLSKTMLKVGKPERKRSKSPNENTRFLIIITTRAVAQTHPCLQRGAKCNFDE